LFGDTFEAASTGFRFVFASAAFVFASAAFVASAVTFASAAFFVATFNANFFARLFTFANLRMVCMVY
jgi:hypothetical protein